MLKALFYALAISTATYSFLLAALTIPFLQNQVIYLNCVTLTWFQDVNVPERWGFLHNQVTPFNLPTPDGEHEQDLLEEPSGLAPDITDRLGFKLLRDDPSSLLVLYFHGAAGTLGSGWRPPSYRAMSAGAPDRIHTVAIDYRGFGASTGIPSEEGLLKDAISLAEWAMNEAGIPPSRIVLFAQSLGTAVSISLADYMAAKPDPILFSGIVLVAPFANVELLTATYRIAGTIPILDPIARFPRLLAWLNTFILTKWPSKDTLAEFVRQCESMPGDTLKYHIAIIHAEDDYDIPWTHSEQVFWHAVNASLPEGISYEELEERKETSRMVRGAGGWVVDWQAPRGVIREEIMKYGLHDRIMSYPVVSSAVMRAFGNQV
ncbi:alpha/beta-hydrolase [Hypoxylon sp. FL0543]|nr:alpha/beta-hydrolase [Hypoxylon sp. FL0543]